MNRTATRTLSAHSARRQMILLRMGAATVLAAGAITAWGLLNPAQAQGSAAPAVAASTPAAASAPARGMRAHGHEHHREGRRADRHGAGPEGMHGADGMGMMGGRQLDRLLDGLKVTPEQRAQIKDITGQAREDARAMHGQGRELHRAYIEQLTQPRIDAGAVKAAHDKIVAQHQKMAERMGATQLAIAQVLTPEQRTQLRERMNRLSDRMHERAHARADKAAPRP